MEFKLLSNIVKNIQDTIWNTGVESVKSLRSHTYDTKVVNFPKVQKINGIVSVSNQKRVEKELAKSTILQKSVLNWLKSFKLPTEMKVSNFPPPTKQIPFPESFKISNFPPPVEPIKNIRVSNQPTQEIKDVGKLVRAVEKAVKALKLDPTINVQAPKAEKVIVPPANVTVTQQEIDYKKLAALIPVAKELDIKKLAEAIAKEIAESVVSLGGGGSSSGGNSFYDRSGRPARATLDDRGRVLTSPDYFVVDKEVGTTVTYIGNENSEGAWYMMMISGDNFRYASSSNNAGLTYAEAWADKENLVYDYPSKVSF